MLFKILQNLLSFFQTLTCDNRDTFTSLIKTQHYTIKTKLEGTPTTPHTPPAMALEIDMQLTGITGIAKGYIAFHSKVPSECRKLHFLTVYCEYLIPHPPTLPWTTPLAKQFSKSTIPSFHPLPPPLSPSPTLPREIKCYSLVQGQLLAVCL